MKSARVFIGLLLVFSCIDLFSQVVSTSTGGAWSTKATWMGNVVPVAGQSVVINGPVTLNVNTPALASLTINSGATLTSTMSAVTLTVTGALIVDGTYTNKSAGAITAGSITFNIGSIYNHGLAGGTIPAALWNSGSTCNITGATGSAPSGLSQSFYNLGWNCAGQTSGLSVPTTTIGGMLSVVNTKGQTLTFGSPTVSLGSLNIGASGKLIAPSTALIVNGAGGTFVLNGAYTSGSETVTFSGSTTLSGTKLASTPLNNVSVNNGASISLSNNLLISGSSFVNNGTVSTGASMITIGTGPGSGPTFTNNGTFTVGTGTVSMAGGIAQTINGSSHSQFYNLTINNSSGVTIGSQQTVTNNLTLTTGVVTTGGLLSMSNGATISIKGASTSLSASPGGGPWIVSYSPGANYNTGNEIPGTGVLSGLISAAGSGKMVTLRSNIVVTGATGFKVTSGTFSSGVFSIATTTATISAGAIFIEPTTSMTLTQGDLSVSGTYTAIGTLIFGGNSAQNIVGTKSNTNFKNITVNNGATLVSPAVLNVTGDFLNSGTFSAGGGAVNIRGNFTDNGTFTAGTGTINFTSNGVQTISGASNTNFYNFVVNKSGGSASVTSAETITNNLTLTAGTLNFTSASPVVISGAASTATLTSGTMNVSGSGGVSMTGTSCLLAIPNGNLAITGNLFSLAAGATINLGNGGKITISSPSGGPWNLIYSGSMNRTTGFEIPSSGSLLSLMCLNTGASTITSNKNFAVGSGGFTINSTSSATSFKSATSLISATSLKLIKGVMSVNGPGTVSVADTLNIVDGTLSITGNKLSMANGATINISGSGSITTSSPSGGPWNLIYSGSQSATSGFEIPSSGSLLSLTNTNSGTSTITLNHNLSVGSGGFIVNSASSAATSFDCGSYQVLSPFVNIISGTLTAPSSTLTLTTGDLSINGSYLNNSGAIVFAGTSAQTITGSNAATTNFNSIIINSGATFNSPANLNVLGTLQNDEVSPKGFVHNNGIVNFCSAFSASTAQIGGSKKIVFYNITVSNGSAGTDLILENSSGADLTNVLSVGTATFDADGSANNRVFTLLSSSEKPTADASIDVIGSGGAVTGNVTVQRYMAREGVSQYDYQVYRDISSPVQNASVGTLQKSLPVTGPFTGTSTVTGADYTQPSLTYFSETTNKWVGFPSADTSEIFTTAKGYSIYIFGPDSEHPVGSGNDLWWLRGPINSGNISPTVTYTSTKGKGWNLIGNPYPSTIDWTTAVLSHVNNAIYIDDYQNATPVYASWVNGVSANGGSNLIPMGQGFYVRANGANPSVSFTENSKKAGTQSTFFRTIKSGNPATLRSMSNLNLLRATLISAKGQRDETVIYFLDSATTDFDNQYDALKLKNRNGYLNLSSFFVSDESYSINCFPLPSGRKTVGIEISDVSTGSYTLRFSDLTSIPSSVGILLIDQYTQSKIDVRQNPDYVFSIDKNESQTFGANRFQVVFNADDLSNVAEEVVKTYPNPVKGLLTIHTEGYETVVGEIYNSLGVKISSVTFEEFSNGQWATYDFSSLGIGFYYVKIYRKEHSYVVRILKE